MTISHFSLSGERFTAHYQLQCSAAEVEHRAREIAIEQTIEFPAALVTKPIILEQIIGQIVAIHSSSSTAFTVAISYPIEAAGRELTQLLNVLFGNVSIKPGVRLLNLELPDTLAAYYRGPRFGSSGLRKLLDVYERPLLCTALKPMGLSALELAELAYQLALGGMDLIKDDHGLSDQPFCPFEERVARCAAAVARANHDTGRQCLYLPNVTAPVAAIHTRAHFAKHAGAGGLLFCPGLGGFDALRELADDEQLALPILSHPAFQGTFCLTPDTGVAQRVLFGQLNRLAGADGTIFPHWGGRFAFTPEECRALVAGATAPMNHLRPIFPVPGGGMTLERVTEISQFYGGECILLIGGDLHAHGATLVDNCRRFAALAAQSTATMQ